VTTLEHHDDAEAAARRATVARAAAVWSPAVRTSVIDTLAGDRAPHAAATAQRAAAAVDRYIAAWTAARIAVVHRGRTGEDAPAALAGRLACLDRRLAEVGALADVLRGGGSGLAAAAIDAAGAL